MAYAQEDYEFGADLDVTAQLMALADLEAYLSLVTACIDIEGDDLEVYGYVRALVKNDQYLIGNVVENSENSNTAAIDGSALSGAEGNIAANVVAGDFNAQSNIASIAAGEQWDSMVEAKIFSVQRAKYNDTENEGMTNSASVEDDALSFATGNIAVNVAAGNNNAQSNMLAVAVAPSGVSVATAYVSQKSMYNSTSNYPVKVEEVQEVPVSLDLSASGSAGATAFGGDYSGAWGGIEVGGFSGETEGTVSGEYAGEQWIQGPYCYYHPGIEYGEFEGETEGEVSGYYAGLQGGCEGGTLEGFVDAQPITLTGSVTGSVPVVVTRNVNTTNYAALGGSALACALGNIGVNIAAGTNNLQANAFSVSYAPSAPAPTVPTVEF
jgi:hypothetical protein